jgi:hypothetical protein
MNLQLTNRETKIILIMAILAVISFYIGSQFSTRLLLLSSSTGYGNSSVVEDEIMAIETNQISDDIVVQSNGTMDNRDNNVELSSQTGGLNRDKRVEVSRVTVDDAERLDALMANPASRQATIAWYIAQQNTRDVGLDRNEVENDKVPLDALLTDPATRQLIIARYLAQQNTRDVGPDRNEVKVEGVSLDTLIADPATRLSIIDWYASRAREDR